MYNDILGKLGISGENESTKFRNLIEFLFDYFESTPKVTHNLIVEQESKNSSKLEVFELLIRALKDHEKSLNIIVERFEKTQTAYVTK